MFMCVFTDHNQLTPSFEHLVVFTQFLPVFPVRFVPSVISVVRHVQPNVTMPIVYSLRRCSLFTPVRVPIEVREQMRPIKNGREINRGRADGPNVPYLIGMKLILELRFTRSKRCLLFSAEATGSLTYCSCTAVTLP